MKRLLVSGLVVLAVVIGGIWVSQTLFDESREVADRRLVPVAETEVPGLDKHEADVAAIIAAAYSAAGVPVTVDGAESSLAEKLPAEADGTAVAEAISHEIQMSAKAKSAIAGFVDELSAIFNGDADGPELEQARSVETMSADVERAGSLVSRDRATDELVLEISSQVTSNDSNGVETVELMEIMVVIDPEDGSILSFKQLETEDYGPAK